MTDGAQASIPTPGAPESGPTSGTTPAVATDVVAPADSSADSAPVVEVVTEVAAPEVAVESPVEAAAEEKAPDPEVEPKAEPEAKAEPEVKAEPEAKAEPVKLEPPVYDEFKIPEGAEVDAEKMTGFSGLLGEFQNAVVADPSKAKEAAQEFGQKLLDMHTEQVSKLSEAATQHAIAQNAAHWNDMQDQWVAAFRGDKELGGKKAEATLKNMGALMDLYGADAGTDKLEAVRSVLNLTGAGNNLEVLRFVNWAAGRLVEQAKPVAAPQAKAPVAGSKASRLYRNSNGAA